MNLDPRLADLLLRWEEFRAQGRMVSPEELCRDCPELLQDLVNGLSALQTTCYTLHGTPQDPAASVQPRLGPSGVPVIGDYQVLATLGQGGMGVVYQAYDRKRQEMVALKTLQRVNASTIYRLKQEFRALSEVAHPNLVGLYELISTGEQCFVAMELIEGVHFLSYIRPSAGAAGYSTVDYDQPLQLDSKTDDTTVPSNAGTTGELSPQQYDRLRSALRQLAQGVSALHAHGKLHRDIKPSNVMVTDEGRVVLLDFGLVAELDVAGIHQSTDQNVTGTVAYMAPEQAASQAQSEASDWYSVGVVLYEALTGQLPFTGAPLQILMDKQIRPPRPPAELVPNVPEDLNSLCVDLLSKSAAARPTGAEVLERLGEGTSPVDVSAVGGSAQTQRASFVGRETQLAELHEAFHAVRQGRTSVVRLQGRSGAGKSLLAHHFIDDLKERGDAVVLAGKCYERESVPYKALDSLIDSLSRYLRSLPAAEAQSLLPREPHLLTRVFPVLKRVPTVADAPGRATEIIDPHELRRRAFIALRELLARLGDRKPLILFIDDLQWGDVDGATQLAELFRPPDVPVFLLLACYRSEDAQTSPCLEILNRTLDKAGKELDQRRLSVDQLSHEEARELALNLLGRRDAETLAQADTIARESGGNPFFVQVLVQCIGTGVDAVADSSIAGTMALDEILWSRIQTLSEEPRRLLEVVAVSGQPLRRDEARHAAELSHDEHGTMAVLRSARLIRSIGAADQQEVETYHDRVRETILNHLPTDAVKGHHHKIATVLESAFRESDPSAAQLDTIRSPLPKPISDKEDTRPHKAMSSKRMFDLAYHFDAAGESQRAFPYAMAMADQARAQYALEIAEQLYRIAERGAGKTNDETRYRVAESLGDVQMLRGRYPDAAIRFKVALQLTSDVLSNAQMEGKLAELAFKCGDMKTATETTERALRMLGNRVPCRSETFMLSLFREAFVQLLHTLFPKCFLARKRLEGMDSHRATVRLHNRLAYCYWFGKGKIPCLWSHLRGMNLAEGYPPTPELGQAYSIHAPVMGLVPYFNRGITYAQKSLAVYKSVGDLWGQGQSQHFYGVVLYAASQYGECIEKCRNAIRLLERTGDLWEVNIARYHIANCLYRLGDLPGAVAEAKQVYQLGLELGDVQGMGICMDVWAPASGGQIPPDVLQSELERPRDDVQVAAQVMFAEGVRLYMSDRFEDAAAVFNKAYRIAANEQGVKSAWTYPLRSWLASALRRQAEKLLRSSAGNPSALLKSASKIARRALRTARTFQNDLPHALRETGLIAELRGQVQNARQYLDESLEVATRQGARFEHAQTLLARGQVGQKHGWPEAQQDLTTARQTLRALGADFALDTTETS